MASPTRSDLPGSAWVRRDKQKTSHLLADDLRRQILGGQLSVDEQLPTELELMGRFEVSRESLREALRILKSQSLVEVRRGRGGGAVVRRPGLEAVGRYVGLVLHLRSERGSRPIIDLLSQPANG